MNWINNGRFSVEEVKDAYGTELDVVKVQEFNQGRGRDYDYWDSIKHPKTGEKLIATQGYLERNGNKCFYAEYCSEDGKYYNYTYGMNGESIHMQQRMDRESRNENIKYSEARKNFSDLMNGNKSSEKDLQNTNNKENIIKNDRL